MYNSLYIYIYERMNDCVRLYTNFRCDQLILRVKHFYTNQKQCEGLPGYLTEGCRPGGDWANT